MKQAAALTRLIIAGWLQAEEPRWTASVPLWKVLGHSGDVIAVHPGPAWLDSTGPVMPAARISRIERVPDSPTPKAEPTLPMPREVPQTLPMELRMLDQEPLPPQEKPKGPSLGPSLGPVKGPDLGLLPIEATTEEEPIGDLFASDRSEPPPPRTLGLITTDAVAPRRIVTIAHQFGPRPIAIKHLFASPYFPVRHPASRASLTSELPSPAKFTPPPQDE